MASSSFPSITMATVPFFSSSSSSSSSTNGKPSISFPLHSHRPLTLSCNSLPNSSSLAPSFDLHVYCTDIIAQMESSLSDAIPVRYPEKVCKSMRYSVLCSGSKHAPPVMCVTTACYLLGVPRDAVFPTACALGMVHAASLVHDDPHCMDSAPLRRSLPTNHSIFGEDISLLSWDALFPIATLIISETPVDLVPEETLLRVIVEISRTVGPRGMAAGQLLDLKGGNVGQVDAMHVLEKKFGELAQCSVVCGGLLGGAEGEVLESLGRYGRAIGVLYEVVDDILMEENGSGGKIRSKNSSVVAAYGMERATEIADELREKAKAEVRWLEEIYGLEKVMPLYGFLEYAVERGFGLEEGRAEKTTSAALTR